MKFEDGLDLTCVLFARDYLSPIIYVQLQEGPTEVDFVVFLC